MQRHWRWIHNVVFLGLVVGSVLLPRVSSAQPQASSPTLALAPGTFRLEVTGDIVSLEAQAASIRAILAELGRQTGIAVRMSQTADDTITLHFDRVPLREALTRLAKNVAVVNAQGPNAPPHGIAAVYVLTAGQAGVPHEVQDRPPPSGETGREPASRPAPFQFTFDPSQHVKQP
jgi:hypothetical protein